MSDERELREHLEELRKRIIRIVIAISIITAVVLTFGVKEFEVNGSSFWMLYPEPFENIAMQITFAMKETLLPEQVELIQIAPGQAFFAQFYVAVLLGMIFGMPVIARELAAFLSPALHPTERETIKKITLPSISLFAAGCIFAYLVVVPYVLNFLYMYGESIGVQTLLNITEFVSFTMQFMVAFGLSFQLPIVMWAVSKAEMVEPKFWRENLRYAILVLVIFGAVITPDGSGITMWFVAMPMLLLYVLGMLLVESKMRKVAELKP
ncbi:MAG: twin-arginine translocase subunit TatC [Nitrososphaerales archaeon]